MKERSTVVKDVARRLSSRWNAHLAGDDYAFPHSFPLGRPDKDQLLTDYAAVHARTVEWQDWIRHRPAQIVYETRMAQGGSRQAVPSHLRVETIEAAATIVGDGWPARLARGQERLDILRERFADTPSHARTLRLIDGYSDIDVELLLKVADWYRDDPARATIGVTPRQVPIPGVHAKWLQTHTAGVQALTGLTDLGVLPRHASRIHFTYLDPGHRSAGTRLHDSATVGDAVMPAYLPNVVIISENKDTAIHFPPLRGAIAVEGVGRGGKSIASFPWLRDAPIVVYWGDIDRDGLEILNGYRSDFGRDIHSILMDPVTYDAYERYGTHLDQYGRPIQSGAAKPVGFLHDDERELYQRLLDPNHHGHRRIEQERIPLEHARTMVEQFMP